MKKKFLLMMMLSLLFTAMGTSVLNAQVAKVGDTEYATIDEAIAAWTNGTTLTLLADVTLSDVIKLSSTEYHILDLGTYTMTAAKNKDAIQYVINGRSSLGHALDIKADPTNPGGITATGGSVVRHTKPLMGAPTKDRPITRFYGGVFNANYVVRQGGTFGSGYTGASAPSFYFYDGEYNGTISTDRSLNQFYGGTFNGQLWMSVDSSAYTLIKGGTFKNLSNLMGSALNSEKFTIGSEKGKYDREVYIDDNGDYVIATADPSQGIQADVAKTPGTNDYLAYSKVKTEGQLAYTNVYTAIDKNKSGTITVYVDELDLINTGFTGTIVVPAEHIITITNAPEGLKVTDVDGNTITPNANGTYTTVEPAGNNFTGYTGTDGIWGEVWGNATTSFVIKVLDADGEVMGTTSLNNVDGIIDGDVNVTWNIKLDAASNTDEYWTMAWTTAPTIDNMPAKVELWVDGVKVSGGNVVLNGPDEIAKIYAAVTDASGKILGYYTDIQEAIKAAAAVNGARANTAGTVEILANVTVDKWIMFSETLNIGSGQIITMNIDGLTIDGNGKTVTIKDIESAGNGGYLIFDATNLNVKDLTIEYADGLVGGIGLTSGTISNVTFNGGNYGVFPGANGVTIENCTFNGTKSSAVYYEEGRQGIVVKNNSFNTADGAYAITMRSNEQFTGNTINKGRVNIANSSSATVTGNNFGQERFKVYNAATATISENTINNLVFNDKTAVFSTFENNTLSEDAQQALENANFPVAQIGDVKYGTLAEAVAAAETGATITLFNGEHELPLFAGKELTFKGESKDGVIVNDAPDARAQGWNGSTFHFENLTAKGATENYHGLANGVVGVTYKDCNINGLRFLYSPTTFTNCAFNANGVEHSFWTYGASKVTVKNSTFTYTDRAVNCYSENGANHEADITFEVCSFTYAGTNDTPEGAVEINSGSAKSFDIAFTNCTAPAKGAMWFNSQWDSTGGAKTEVIVDGVVVWTAPVKIGETKYATLEEAFKAVKAGETVTIFEGTYEVPAMKAGITVEGEGEVLLEGTLSGTLEDLTLKNLHIKGGNAQRWAYGKGNLLFEKVTFEATSVYALHFDGITAGTNLTYMDCTIIGWAAMGGSPASCVFEGCTIKGNGTYGVIRTYFDTTIKDCIFDVTDVSTTDAYEDGIHAVEGAEVVVDNCTNTNGDMKDIVNVHGTSVVTVDGVEIKNAAKAGNKYYATFEEAFAAVQAGETLTLLADLNLSEILVINKAITFDGNGKTLTSSAGRAINVSGAEANGVKIQNLTINASGERAINVIQNATNVTIDNVTATAANYTVNVAASAPNAVVAIKNSTLNGLCTVNVAAAGSQVTVDNSTVNCNDNNTTAGESYAALCLNKEAVGGSIVATNSTINVTDGSDSKKAKNAAEGGVITIDGSTDGVAVMVAAITYEGSNYYYSFATLEDAIDFAEAGDVVSLIRDITASDKININKSITLDGNGKTLTYEGTDRAIDVPNDANANIDVTIKNLTVVATTANRGLNYNENGKFNVEGVTVTIGENVDGYAINFPGMADNAQVTIKNSKLTSRNPLNIWGENMVINVYDSEIISVDNNSTYDYAAIQLNNEIPTVGPNGAIANGTVVNVYGGTITALNDNGEPSYVVANATETGVVNISDETVVTGKVLDYVANIGGVYFGSLQAAVDAIEKYGYTSPIVIMKSFATSETATVKNGLNVTINLNGKTITATDNATGSYAVITNQGDLTINGEGAIRLTATNNRGWNAYSSVISNTVGGKLIVNGGTIEHLGGTDMAYAIDNLTNGQGTYAETIINGGTMKSPYRAIRQFLNGIEAQNILNVTGGTIEGTNKSIWMQDPSKNANTGTLTVGVNASLKGDVYLSVTAGSTSWPVTVSIADEALKDGAQVLTANVPAGYELQQDADGNYVVNQGVAKIGDVLYATLQDALDAGGNVTVLRDIALAEGLTVAADKTVVLDLNGKTISRDTEAATSTAAITNNGNLTIKDSSDPSTGKITAFAANPDTQAVPYYASNTITNYGVLTVLGGTIENSTGDEARAAFPIDNNSTSRDAIVTIEGGKVTGRGAIRQFANSTTHKNEVNVKGGEVFGSSYAIWVQNPGSGDPKSALNIEGGKLSKILISPSANFDIAISGGELTEVAIWNADETNPERNPSNFISGGTFTQNMEEFCVEGYKMELNENGTYGVVPFETKEYVINANGEIKTLADAIAKAKEDGTDEVTYTIYGAATLETGYSQGIVDFGGREGYITIQGGSDNTRSTDSFKITGGGVPDIKGVTFKDLTFYDEGEYLPTANEFMYQNFIDCKFENVKFEDGIRLSGNSVVRNCTFNANTNDEYAIWLDEGTFEMTGSTVTAGNDAYGLLKSDVVDKITISGNTFQYLAKVNKEALNVKGATIVATGNTFIDCAKGVVPKDKTNYTEDGTTPITNEIIAQNNTVVVYVAKINDTKYESLAAAATAAQSGETIQLIWAEGNDPISMAATFVGDKTVTITGTADVDWSKGWFFVGRGGEGDGHVIFDNANLTSTSVGSNSGLGLNVSCKKEGESTTNDGEVEIINSNIQLDYLIGKGNIKLDNSTLEVYEGFAVGARPASETGEVQRTVTMDITKGSNVIVDNHNGQGLGHESNGIMNIDATSTFETKRSFLITANGTMNNAGTVTINGTLTNNGTINLTDVALTGMTIDGTGTTYFYNTVNFYGNNNITTNINGAPFELIVNEDATLLISRFVLGYDRAITVYGNIEDAHNLTAEQIASMTPSLKFNSTSGVSVGGTATGKLTAKDAYLEFGSSSWKNSHAEHTWSFENCYVSATSFGNNNEPGAVTSTWNVTFDNSVLAAKNYIKNGVGVTYNFTSGSVATTGSLRIDGTLNVDANSSVTTTGQQNNVQNAVDEHGGINGTINIDGTLTIGSNSATQLEVLGGEVNVTETGNIKLHGNTLTLDAASKMRSCGNITGAITAAEGADIEITGGTYTMDVNKWCHEYYDAIPNGDGTWTVEQVMYALVRDLQEGWSWFSSFINIDGEAGLTKIKDALGENGVQVKDAYSGSFIQYTSASGWKGLLNEASSKAVYSIKTINDGDDIPEISVKDFTIKGAKVDPSLLENTVYINKGWNYIAYPLDQVAGLDVLSFTPAEGDVIKSKESSSMYWGGVWISNIDMTPGEGYMYKSNDDATKSFNFAYPTRSAVDASISNNVTNDYYWSVNAHKYPSNMTIVAMLNIDNELVKDSYEIAAFANGECRGRAQSVYVESLDTYVLVLTVHGEDVENITFKYYDVNSGAEYELSNIMVYSNDAIVGSVDEPYMFNLDILNVDEASINEVNVYPNPTTTNAEIDLNATCDKVEVFNALGVKVAEYSNVDSIDALETAGIYVIRITNDGNVQNCRLVVK